MMYHTVSNNKNALSSLQILDHHPDSSFLSLADVIGPSTNAGIRSVDSGGGGYGGGGGCGGGGGGGNFGQGAW